MSRHINRKHEWETKGVLLKVGILFGLKNKYADAVGAISTNDVYIRLVQCGLFYQRKRSSKREPG